jgi:hypothetical protein
VQHCCVNGMAQHLHMPLNPDDDSSVPSNAWFDMPAACRPHKSEACVCLYYLCVRALVCTLAQYPLK